ncbi:MAG: PQQ-binding-like beta-propeller repeat protein [Candidatus Polarisedimenticolia bacterium]
MRRTTMLLLVLGAVLVSRAVSGPALLASEQDGILLEVVYGPAGGGVHMSWTGAPPNYHVYRAAAPNTLVNPSNEIGLTGFASWDDTPPAGFLFFYEISASCAPSPVEVCDGLDNDCDGTTDEPGSEASCNLPHAAPQCVMGSCAIASCNIGFANCDGLANDGCEAVLDRAQSTSPDAYGGPGNPDLRPGFVRVASITNCGGCGVTCDDGIPCTTDLCVPSPTGPAQCRHYNRAQCGGARCNQASLPPGTPAPTEPACAGLDADNDGLYQEWETSGTDPYTGLQRPTGIDLNCDGEISGGGEIGGNDLVWHEPPSGEATKDLYVEFDYMGPAPGEPEGHAPSPEALAEVVSAFAANGISLHIDPNHQALPHAAFVYLPVAGAPTDACASLPGAVSLYDSVYKGSPGNFDQRRKLGYHYMLFAHDSCCAASPSEFASGMAELGGDDAIVSMGAFAYAGSPEVVERRKSREYAGTFMHELGHNLGLCHDGVCDFSADPNAPNNSVQMQPNLMSVMSYSHQLSGILRSGLTGEVFPPDPNEPRRFDFSHEVLSPLDEHILDEFAGVNAPLEPFSRDIIRHYCPEKQPGPVQGPAMGPIDWDCDGTFEFPVVKDVNADGQLTTLLGGNDWGNLSFSFQCQPTLQDGAQDSTRLARSELTQQQADQQRLRAGPLSCAPGLSDCDEDDANGCEHTGPCGCTPAPEVCDGLDNDCDGQTDEPGSEASCSIPNATPECLMGSCAIGSCNLGYGDCDGGVSNGCEAPLGVAQSTSPAAYGGPGDPDLKPGYARVGAIANCGGCGVSCDDGIPCTTDLCVPSATGAQCRHYDRAQCGGARCPQGNLPPGTPPPTEAVCAGPDNDNDGLSNQWESGGIDPYTGQPQVPGIDIDCDGEVSSSDNDMIWHEPPSGDSTKDVYLQIDYMAPSPGETGSHAPSPAALSGVVSAFAGGGVSLHIDPNHQALPHAAIVYMPVNDPVDACAALPGAVSLYDSMYKGNPGVFDPKRRLGYHWTFFAHDSCSADTPGHKASGMAEIDGNDAIVSLASFTYQDLPPVADSKKAREETGTLMHELGHNLRLHHGGPFEATSPDPNGPTIVRKPNYPSVMNYSHQLNGILRSAFPGQVSPPDPDVPRRFDFSHGLPPPLDETFLDEFAGVNVPLEPFSRDVVRHYCPEKSPGPVQSPSMGPIDWNCDSFFDTGVVEDVNADGQLTTLFGGDDWGNLSFSFQCQPTFADGAQDSSRLARTELTLEQAVDQQLRSAPLICDPGTNDCDGDDSNGCETTGSCPVEPTCTPDSLWSTVLGVGEHPVSAPASDTTFNPSGGSFTYLSKGDQAYSLYNKTVGGNSAGSVHWTRSLPTTSQSFPNPVPLKDGSESVYVAGADGFLRSLDPNSGADRFAPFDTRRPACSSDQIIATPAVQLWNQSNSAFQTAQQEDLVFVITRTMCGDSSRNKVFAIRAATGTLAWIFDPISVGISMSYGTEQCTVDYTNNSLYCGTDQGGGAQNTLWAINTLNGALKWARNYGSIYNRPLVRGSRVYVATYTGTLRALSITNGLGIWSLPLSGVAFVRNPTLVSGGSSDGMILVPDTSGNLYAYVDSGSIPVILWNSNFGGTVYTTPVVIPAIGKAYVAMADGRIYQFLLTTGAVEASATAGTAGPAVGLSLDAEGPPGSEANRLTATAVAGTGKRARRYCIPWAFGSSGTM